MKPKRKRGRPKSAAAIREPNGRPSRRSKEDIEQIMAANINARAREMPGVPVEDLRREWMGCRAGRMIANEEDAPDLWQTIKTIRSRRRAWLRVIEAPDENPAISSIKPESDYRGDEAQPSDIRSETEKAASAETAWNAVANALFALNPLYIRYIEMLVVRDEDVKGPPLAPILRHHELKKAVGQ